MHSFSTKEKNEAARVLQWFGRFCVSFFFSPASIPANLCTASMENHIHGNQLHHSYPHQWRLQSKLSNILCTSCKIELFSSYLCASSFRGYMFMQMRIVLFLSGWLNIEFVLHLGNAKPCCLATWSTTSLKKLHYNDNGPKISLITPST